MIFLKRYGISEEQLHADAMENSPNVRPIHVMVMGSMIEQLMGMGPETILKDESVQSIAEVISNGMGSENPMFIVTNSQTVGGAGVIFLSGSNGSDRGRLSGKLFLFCLLPLMKH